MRVGFVSRYPPVHCGVAEYTKMLISALLSIAPRIEICVLSSREAEKEERIDEPLGIRVIPSFDVGSPRFDGILDALAEIGGVEVLHIEHEYGIFGRARGVLEAAKEARREGLSKLAVITMHTVVHPRSGRERELEFQRELAELGGVVVHSFLQEFELQWQGVPASRICRIPHGTLINPYLGLPRRKLADSLGIKRDSLRGAVLAVPGFLRKDKGLDVLLGALRHTRRREFAVLVAGEPRDKEVLEMLEEASERTNVVLLEKYLSSDEILRIVALADVLVLPYIDHPGTYSVSGILHLSMGGLKPIVGSRVPRLVELYQYAPRLTVAPRDPVSLAASIDWLVENYDYSVAYMATLYGYAARTQWLRMARRHLRLYRALLKGRTASAAVETEPPPLPP